MVQPYDAATTHKTVPALDDRRVVTPVYVVSHRDRVAPPLVTYATQLPAQLQRALLVRVLLIGLPLTICKMFSSTLTLNPASLVSLVRSYSASIVYSLHQVYRSTW